MKWKTRLIFFAVLAGIIGGLSGGIFLASAPARVYQVSAQGEEVTPLPTTVQAICNPRDSIVGGGYELVFPGNVSSHNYSDVESLRILFSKPVVLEEEFAGHPRGSHGWAVSYWYGQEGNAAFTVRAWAVCRTQG